MYACTSNDFKDTQCGGNKEKKSFETAEKKLTTELHNAIDVNIFYV